MSKTKASKIHCTHCKKWFKTSIVIEDYLEGHIVHCPYCNNKEVMKINNDGGGLVEDKTI